MPWFKRNSPLSFGLVLLAALLALEVGCWSRGREQARRGLTALAQKKQERTRLARHTPALSEENAQAIAHDLGNTRQVAAALHTVLLGHDAEILKFPPPAKSIDAFFDLAAYGEKITDRAMRGQVATRSGERFGFSSHTQEGPAAELVAAVSRQRILAQYLVETLLEARPAALLSVQRELPLTAVQRARRNQPLPPGLFANAGPSIPREQAADFFLLDRQLSVRVPGQVDSDAFRLEFTGQTPVLRTFLNRLATFQLPGIVRSVEVQPVTAAVPPAALPTPPVAAGALVPLVTQNLSHYVVIVEFPWLGTAPTRPVP